MLFSGPKFPPRKPLPSVSKSPKGPFSSKNTTALEAIVIWHSIYYRRSCFYHLYHFPASSPQENKHFWALSRVFCCCPSDFSPRSEFALRSIFSTGEGLLRIARMKLLFSNYLGDYSYSFQGSVELICITVAVSLFFYAEYGYSIEFSCGIFKNLP